MAAFKHEFYSTLRQEFIENPQTSFLYQYLKKEKNQQFRLRIRLELKKLKDTLTGRRAYGAFLLKNLSENQLLKKLLPDLKELTPLLRQAPSLQSEKANKTGTKAANPSTLAAELYKELSRSDSTVDFSMDVLNALSMELLKCLEYTGERTDSYVCLESGFLDLEMGLIREPEYLSTFLKILSENKKLTLKKSSRDLLWSYAVRLGGPDVFADAATTQAKYKRLITVLKDRPEPVPSFGERKLYVLHQELLDRILQSDARTFLYDAGYPINKGTVCHPQKAPRKKDRTMDMLNAYCMENGISLYQSLPGSSSFTIGGWTEERKERCEQLYQRLKGFGGEALILPVEIDPLTGAGLYIIGKEHFPKELYSKINGACCYVCFYLNMLELSKQFISLQWGSDKMDGTILELCGCPSLEEALSWYFHTVRENAFEFFKDTNWDMPKACPDEFKCYFYGEKQLAEEPLSEEELLEVRKEFS